MTDYEAQLRDLLAYYESDRVPADCSRTRANAAAIRWALDELNLVAVLQHDLMLQRGLLESDAETMRRQENKLADEYSTVRKLESEISRLREGRFTEQERQNFCHNLTTDNVCDFQVGCLEYWQELFGEKLLAETEDGIRDQAERAVELADVLPLEEMKNPATAAEVLGRFKQLARAWKIQTVILRTVKLLRSREIAERVVAQSELLTRKASKDK